MSCLVGKACRSTRISPSRWLVSPLSGELAIADKSRQNSAGVPGMESDMEDKLGDAGGSGIWVLRPEPRGAATMAPREVRCAPWKKRLISPWGVWERAARADDLVLYLLADSMPV